MAELNEEDYAKIVLDLSKSKEERIQAAFHLENAVKKESLLALCKGLMEDPSPIVRHEFAFSLGECGAKDLVAPYLMKAVENDKSVFVRHEAILALSTLGKPEYREFIKRFLSDPDAEMAESAEIALQRLDQTGSNF